jgi:hypothetical protein
MIWNQGLRCSSPGAGQSGPECVKWQETSASAIDGGLHLHDNI